MRIRKGRVPNWSYDRKHKKSASECEASKARTDFGGEMMNVIKWACFGVMVARLAQAVFTDDWRRAAYYHQSATMFLILAMGFHFNKALGTQQSKPPDTQPFLDE
jgi:hypothetical protein